MDNVQKLNTIMIVILVFEIVVDVKIMHSITLRAEIMYSITLRAELSVSNGNYYFCYAAQDNKEKNVTFYICVPFQARCLRFYLFLNSGCDIQK
jgi:hypothetical protein